MDFEDIEGEGLQKVRKILSETGGKRIFVMWVVQSLAILLSAGMWKIENVSNVMGNPMKEIQIVLRVSPTFFYDLQ